MLCSRCGDHFNIGETRASFNHYYSGSAEWDYDDIPERLCLECAKDDVESRWLDGTLKAADGDPSLEGQKKWLSLQESKCENTVKENEKMDECVNCGQSLSKGIYTLPWEDDDNPDAYITCPYCGCENIVDDYND